MSDFTADPFNIERQYWESYRRFIERLRNLVAVGYSHNRPVTPLEVNPPTSFFDIVLQTNDHSIRLRLRRDNLYLVGYQMHDSNEWLELRYDHNNERHRIANSTFLGFGDTYGNLLGAAGVDTLSGIQAGRQELIDAINLLAFSRNDATRARSLLVVIVMIVESVRFNEITMHFGTVGRTSSPIPAWIQDFVRGWRSLSAALLHHDADNNFQLPPINNFGYLRDFEAAVVIIGIIKGYFFGPGGHRLHKRSADDGWNINEHYPAGRPLVELFSVTINHVHGNPHIFGDIYGMIEVSDGLGYEYVYNRDMNSSELIRAGETISLEGPARCITAYDSFTVNLALMSREGLSEDNEISNGQVMWEVTNISSNEYDVLLFEQIEGRFGSATLCYAVLSDAVEALIDVILIKNGDPCDVYGLVTCHNINLNSENVLFRKTQRKFVNVKPGELIPLSRSVVAVPLNSNFIVCADLKGSNYFSSDDEVANGTAAFTPQLYGTDEQIIYGNNNSHIRIMISWSWYV